MVHWLELVSLIDFFREPYHWWLPQVGLYCLKGKKTPLDLEMVQFKTDMQHHIKRSLRSTLTKRWTSVEKDINISDESETICNHLQLVRWRPWNGHIKGSRNTDIPQRLCRINNSSYIERNLTQWMEALGVVIAPVDFLVSHIFGKRKGMGN